MSMSEYVYGGKLYQTDALIYFSKYHAIDKLRVIIIKPVYSARPLFIALTYVLKSVGNG